MADLIIRKGNSEFHKEAFDKTTDERRQNVINVALEEFSSKGYSGTSINDIAKNAGISIGSMYSYFASKEDLFLTIVNNAYYIMTDILNTISNNSKDVFECVEKMLSESRRFAIEYRELNQIYLDLTTQALTPLAVRLSDKIENVTPHMLAKKIQEDKLKGKVREDVDEKIAAFCIDNMVMIYQFSFSSNYYMERMKIYLGEENINDLDRVEDRIMQFVKKGILKVQIM